MAEVQFFVQEELVIKVCEYLGQAEAISCATITLGLTKSLLVGVWAEFLRQGDWQQAEFSIVEARQDFWEFLPHALSDWHPRIRTHLQ